MKRNLVTTLAIALLLLVGLEAAVGATSSGPDQSQVVYNGKCPGDKDDDCKD